MERASRLLRKLSLPADSISCEDLVRKAWPRAVGKKVAGHTRPARMVRLSLIVEVEDAVWQRQLFGLSRQILANLEKTLGHGLVEHVEFRVVPPRREPHRAGQIAATLELIPDEADAIADATLRRIYKTARKKALA